MNKRCDNPVSIEIIYLYGFTDLHEYPVNVRL